MKYWKSRVWSPLDIAALKWSCILFGGIFGAYFPAIIKAYIWWVIGITVALSAWVMYRYTRED